MVSRFVVVVSFSIKVEIAGGGAFVNAECVLLNTGRIGGDVDFTITGKMGGLAIMCVE